MGCREKIKDDLGKMVNSCNYSTWEAEIRGLPLVQGHLGLRYGLESEKQNRK